MVVKVYPDHPYEKGKIFVQLIYGPYRTPSIDQIKKLFAQHDITNYECIKEGEEYHINVLIGTELEWIERLEDLKFVKYAAFIYLPTIHNEICCPKPQGTNSGPFD